ncbi:MAG: FAD:protein FMN transferase [Clostridia bacterium]|nr:FAD:protein FMN transferase [Clostridia bacterium]MDD4146032.1 FAD:protein FMN transferase [Clostridia bacterium]MDD4665603.1 FAD:protein FMN transferase [Clostridia bacterium]
MKKFRLALVIISLGLVLGIGIIFFAQSQERELMREEFLMDTLVSISTYGTDTDFLQEATQKAFLEIRRIADLTNRFPLPSITAAALSDVIRINEMAGIKPVVVDEDVFKMLQLAQEYNRLTEGAFDVTIGPVMDLWGFGREKQKVPTASELQKALALVDSRKLILDQKAHSAFLNKKGMALDLGAVAKGYAVEKAAQVLEKEGVEKALINAGGNIRVLGKKEKWKPWKIGIQDPRTPSALMGILSLEDEAVVTSGDYNRTIQIAGKTYHHLLSSQTGYPVGYNISVTVVTRDAAQADLLSTALFLLEPQQALEFAAKLNKVEVVLVTADKKILCSPGLRGKIELRPGEEYSYD